jgi:hypothetical protein
MHKKIGCQGMVAVRSNWLAMLDPFRRFAERHLPVGTRHLGNWWRGGVPLQFASVSSRQ